MAEANTCLREIEVEVPAEEVEKETRRVVKAFARQARVPGFRPGKAPAEIVQRRFWDDIRGEVLHSLLPTSLEKTLTEKKLTPVDRPSIVDLEFESGKPLRYKASFEVFPDIQLGEYKGLKAPAAKIVLKDEDIEQELERIREQFATYEPVEDRPARDGDTVVASLVGTFKAGETREPLTLENAEVRLGEEGTLEAFSKALQGVKAGNQREFEVNYPGDYPDAKLAGQTVAFAASVSAVRHKVLPDLNDEFAQEAGGYKTLQEFRVKLREGMEAMRDEREKQLTRHNVLDALLGAHDFPVPEALVEQQMNTRLERRVRALAAQGIDPQKAPLDWNRLRAEQRDGAEREVRISLLLERIAQTEKIEATEEDLNQEIERMAGQASQTPQAVRARLTKEGGLDTIKHAVQSDKVVEFLVSHATLTTADDQ